MPLVSRSSTVAVPAPTPGAHLELDLLGPPRAVVVTADGGRTPVAWRLRRSLRIVALLALAEGRRVTLSVSEAASGLGDLNGDGDAEDHVVHVVDL